MRVLLILVAVTVVSSGAASARTVTTGTCIYDATVQALDATGLPVGVPLDYVLTESGGAQHFAFVNVYAQPDGSAVIPLDYVGPSYVRADVIGNVKATGHGYKYTVFSSCPL